MTDNPYRAPQDRPDPRPEESSPALPQRCAHCGGDALYVSHTVASGNGGPNLLPGLGGVIFPAKLSIVTCGRCGLVQLFADAKARLRVARSTRWQQI